MEAPVFPARLPRDHPGLFLMADRPEADDAVRIRGDAQPCARHPQAGGSAHRVGVA